MNPDFETVVVTDADDEQLVVGLETEGGVTAAIFLPERSSPTEVGYALNRLRDKTNEVVAELKREAERPAAELRARDAVTDGGQPECPGCGMAYSRNDEPFCPCGRLRPAVTDRLAPDGGQTPSARLRTIAADLDDVEEDLRREGRYERSLASVLDQMSGVVRRIARRLEDRRSDPDRFRVDDDELLTDGGSQYVNPTGDGYLGVWGTSSWSAEISIGTYEHITWRSDDDVYVVDDPNGIALVDEPPETTVSLAEGYLARARVRKATVGTSVQVPSRGLRELEGFEPGDDIRGYDRDGGGIVLVPATADPFVDEEVS